MHSCRVKPGAFLWVSALVTCAGRSHAGSSPPCGAAAFIASRLAPEWKTAEDPSRRAFTRLPHHAPRLGRLQGAFSEERMAKDRMIKLSPMSVLNMCTGQEQAQAEAAAVPQFDVKGLKKEISRQVLRQLKKVGKAEQRLRKAEARIKELDSCTEEKEELEWADLMEAMPEIKGNVADAAERMARLNALETAAAAIKSSKDAGYEAVAVEAAALGLDDKEPERPPRPEKKPKGQKPPPRKPYNVYMSKDGIEIWVGRGSKDNDELSLRERHPSDWWMHVQGHPGSHVVVRCQDEEPPKETMLDAAILALKFSKGGGGTQPVSVVRCRQVSKNPGAPAGQVMLRGDVSTIRCNLKTEEARLERLVATKDA